MPGEIESQRLKFKPERIRFLFVGESTPAGGTFFYFADSNLYKYTQVAFERVCGAKCGSGMDFLQYFMENSFYLDDLCPVPVNHLNKAERRKIYRNNVAPLADRIRQYKPEAVISVKTSIDSYVDEAITRAKLAEQPSVFHLPFPAMSHQWEYVDRLEEILKLPQFAGLGDN